MSKAVLLMDMPKSCYRCNLTYEDSNGMYCSCTKEDVGNYVSCRSKECPLRLIPEKVTEDGQECCGELKYMQGWNDCINTMGCVDD